jgi:peptidoglycan-associated lipoprotein
MDRIAMPRHARGLSLAVAAFALAALSGCASTQFEDGKYDAAFQDRLRGLGDSYETLEVGKVAVSYAPETFAHAFDIPRNWDTSTAQHDQTLGDRLGRLSELKWEETDEVLTWKRERNRWFTLQAVRVTEKLKDGRVAVFEGRHSAMWEERDGKWVIAHEHFGGAKERMLSTYTMTEKAPERVVASVPAPAAAPPAAPAAAPSVPEVERVTVLADIFFDYDRAEVRDDQRGTVEADAAWLKRRPEAVVTIEGHCDERGSRGYNMALGWRRAEAAKEALVAQGVDGSRLRTISYGKERPFRQGQGEPVWSSNRRAHLIEQR